MPKIDDHLPRLLDGEEVIGVQTFTTPLLNRKPASLRALDRLAGVTNSRDIGSLGPVRAAYAVRRRQASREFHRFEALFGRDALRVALNLLDTYPQLARSTLVTLAELQGVANDDSSEEEPGRIVHEVRDIATDQIAQELALSRGWTWPYYGSVDVTPEYVRLLAAYCQRASEGFAFLNASFVGRDQRASTMADSLKRAVGWITRTMDLNPEGLLEFRRRNPRGLENQAWKDSWDAYFHADGTMANHANGIASVEVQRTVYDALIDAAQIYELQLGDARAAHELRQRAEQLKRVILERFWNDDRGGYFVLGTDRDGHGRLRQLQIRTSNMGHLLHSRLLMSAEPDVIFRREAIIRQLFSPDMLCLNGIRTLASDEVRFRPGAYHNGSCWGWDNYMIAQGLNRHGYELLGDHIERIIIESVGYAHRFVEFMRGDNDPAYRINTRVVDVWDAANQRVNRLEQPPQDMQAWTTSAVQAIKLERQARRRMPLSFGSDTRVFEEEILNQAAATNYPAASTRSKVRK